MLRQRFADFRSLPRDARLYVTAEALSAFATGSFATVYNLYVLALGFDTGFLGTLLVVAMAGAGAAVVPAGAMVDRLGARALLLGGSVTVAAAVGAQLAVPVGATAPVALVLVAGSAVAGAGAATFSVAAAPFLARAAPPERRDGLFSLDTAVTLAGVAVGNAVAGSVATALGATGSGGAADAEAYRLTLLAGGTIGALSFPLVLATRGRGETEGTSGETGEAREASVGASWTVVLRDRVAVRLAVTTALVGLGAGLFVPYLNVFFVQALGAGPEAYGRISGVATLTRLVATLLAPALAARLGTAGAVAATQVASVPFLLLLGFAPGLGVAAPALWARGALMNMAAPLQTSFTMAALGAGVRGSGNALLLLTANATRGVTTLLGGVLIEQVGFRWPYLATAALYLAASLLFWAWFGAGTHPAARPGAGPGDR